MIMAVVIFRSIWLLNLIETGFCLNYRKFGRERWGNR